MTRKQIALFPIVCLLSVILSSICFVLFLVMFIPLMIRPGIFNTPQQYIMERMTRAFMQSVMKGGKKDAKRSTQIPMAGQSELPGFGPGNLLHQGPDTGGAQDMPSL